MYVCLCRGVSERKVRTAINCGATRIDAIGEATGAGTRCGGCWPLLEDMLAEIDSRDSARHDHAPARAHRSKPYAA